MCAGKKVYLPVKKQYTVRQTSQIDRDFNFTEVRTEREEKDQEWILGGQDACHVSTVLLLISHNCSHMKNECVVCAGAAKNPRTLIV